MSTADVLGRFVWHELLTTDTAAAASFYSKVLPWRTVPSSMPGYTIWMAGQNQIGGLMALPADGPPPHWLMYVGTPNVDATCSQAQSLGAKVVTAPADIPNVGRYAVLSDPQGATFAVFTPGSGSPPPGPQPAQGGFSWHELATTDVTAALRFYGTLFEWTKGPGHDMGAMGVYQIFVHGGSPVGGMTNVQGPSTPPAWLSYVHVADCSRAVAAAKGGGGRLLHGPMEVPGGSWIALMMDPQGGAFAVQEAPRVSSQAKPAAAPKPSAALKPSPKPAAAPTKAAAASAAPTKRAPAAKPAAAQKPARKTVAKKAKKAAMKKAAVKKAATKKAATKQAAKKKAARKPARKAAHKPAPKAARRRTPRAARKRTPARRARSRRR